MIPVETIEQARALAHLDPGDPREALVVPHASQTQLIVTAGGGAPA
jgi:hypothetical protein